MGRTDIPQTVGCWAVVLVLLGLTYGWDRVANKGIDHQEVALHQRAFSTKLALAAVPEVVAGGAWHSTSLKGRRFPPNGAWQADVAVTRGVASGWAGLYLLKRTMKKI